MAIKINSSLTPVDLEYTGISGPDIILEPIPAGIGYPQWVNGEWVEYSATNDPEVQRTKTYTDSFSN